MRQRHTVNGRFSGMFYETATGRKLYLAHCKAEDVYRKLNGWCIAVSTLERCRAEGFHAVGVVRRVGRERLVWLTHVEDFFSSPHSFTRFDGVRQRGLPLPRFRIEPGKSAKIIEKSIRLR